MMEQSNNISDKTSQIELEVAELRKIGNKLRSENKKQQMQIKGLRSKLISASNRTPYVILELVQEVNCFITDEIRTHAHNNCRHEIEILAVL